jgi:hypothetical protein
MENILIIGIDRDEYQGATTFFKEAFKPPDKGVGGLFHLAPIPRTQ